MRVVIVSSRVLTPAKRAVAEGLGPRLVAMASVPVRPQQTTWSRHARALVATSGARALVGLAAGALNVRLVHALGAAGVAGAAGGVRGFARMLGVDYRDSAGPNDPGLIEWLETTRADLVISMQSHMVGAAALAAARHGWLNLHHGRLPEYRGSFSVFWAMRNREPQLYVTAHLMDARLDAGPVVVERAVRVPPGASVAEMETEMWRASPAVLLAAVERIESGHVPQPDTRASTKPGFYTYPTRLDVRAAQRSGVRLR